MKYFRIYILFFFSITAICGSAQTFNKTYYPKFETENAEGKKIGISVYNNNFVKNNEYFGNLNSGITYIGSILKPEIVWKPVQNLNFKAGWYGRYFYGSNKIDASVPIISVSYEFLKNFTLNIGAINGDLRHEYLQPLYGIDNYFCKKPEYGVQLLYNSEKFYADIFMDWENFIYPGDTNQEIINGGLIAKYFLFDKKLSVNLQSVLRHYGGQVNNSNSLVTSAVNIAGGLNYSLQLGSKYLKQIDLRAWAIQCTDLSSIGYMPYKQGYAVYAGAEFSNDYCSLNLAWFNGKYYFAPLGENVFQSISSINNWYLEDDKNLIQSSLLLHYPIANGISIGVHFESFYQTLQNRFDFNYGLNLAINQTHFFK